MIGALQNETRNAVQLFAYIHMSSDDFPQSFEHGITQQISKECWLDILYAGMRTLFTHEAAKCGIPLVVLVHEEEMARGVLARSGIDIGSFSSVNSLLQRERGQPQVSISLRMTGFRSESHHADNYAPNVLQITFSTTLEH